MKKALSLFGKIIGYLFLAFFVAYPIYTFLIAVKDFV